MFYRLLSFALLLLPFFAMADASLEMQEPQELVIQNRILAKVNGKTLSMMDVVKKMDVFLSERYPQFAHSKVARYQFYTSHWKNTLNQLVNNELMMADAESREIKVSDGEVRQEVQERFGPNVMGSLDKLGLTYEEARKMVHQDMIVQRMNWFRVHSKALLKVNSEDVKEAYKQYCIDNPAKEEWKYQLLSIRGSNKDQGAALAARAFDLIHQKKNDLAAVADALNAEPVENISISLSQDYTIENKSLSASHKAVLASLEIGAFSPPIEQTSRDNSVVYRIFHLKEHSKQEAQKFEEIAGQLKDDLIQKAVDEQMESYIARLHQRFGYDPLDIPDNFEPFTLR